MPWGNPLQLALIGISGNVPVENVPGTNLSTSSPEQLLATVPAATHSQAVTLPINAQSLIVWDLSAHGIAMTVAGTLNPNYSPVVLDPETGAANRWVVPVDPELDDTVTVSWGVNKPTGTWFILATLATEIVSTIGAELVLIGQAQQPQYAGGLALANSLAAGSPAALGGSVAGQAWTMPTPPNTAASDHPPSELSTTTVNVSANGATILAAPGAGKRYRIFLITATPTAVPSAAYTVGLAGITGTTYVAGLAGAGGQIELNPLSGYPSGIPQTAANTAITLAAALSNTWNITVVYTTETI